MKYATKFNLKCPRNKCVLLTDRTKNTYARNIRYTKQKLINPIRLLLLAGWLAGFYFGRYMSNI